MKINYTGLQAVILGSVLQRDEDEKNNLKTACMFCGYRGSPLSGLDKEIVSRKKILEKKKIFFHPGLNEELACSVIAGTQNYHLFGRAKEDYKDGVFGIWYGKGPGVDRAGDHIHHYNFAGTSKNGGSVLLCGDDHNVKSSTMPHETTMTLVSWFVPVLAPSCVEEIAGYLRHAISLSRYSGSWIAIKIISDLADAYETIDIEKLKNLKINIPEETYDVSIRWPDSGQEQEKRIYEQKIPAIEKYLSLNNINEIIKNNGEKLGIITVGKTFHNLMKIYDYDISQTSFDLLKIGCIWPLQKDIIEKFIHGKEEILILEEKFGVFELFFRKYLTELGTTIKIHGKNGIVSPLMDMSTEDVKSYLNKTGFDVIEKTKNEKTKEDITKIKRTPYYCGGCPHNTGTKLNENDIAVLGIGCHYLANFMPDRPTITVCPMGAEGVNWIAASKFSERDHIFVNLGDGTYFHSGILAIRAAAAAKTKVTYKILYNQAVAMTGGQPIDGELSLLDLTKQLLAEKVEKIFIVSHYYNERKWKDFPIIVDIRPKDQMSKVMKEAKEINGVSVIIYDQMCATEKRRKQKRGLLKKEDYYVKINKDICDACGDCQKKSNCLAIEIENTIFGKKRQIDQSSCNLDLSCLQGYCPSFIVTSRSLEDNKIKSIPSYKDYTESNSKEKLEKPFSILTVGIGGTGISTLTKIISDAALEDGYKIKAMDQTGLAQRYGEVTGRIEIFPENMNSYIDDNEFDLMIGCDLYCSYPKDISMDIKYSVVNSGIYNMPQFIHGNDISEQIEKMKNYFAEKGKDKAFAFNFSKYSSRYDIKESLNILMLGAASWKLPISDQSIMKSIRKNFNNKLAERNIEIYKLGKSIFMDSSDIFDFEKYSFDEAFEEFDKLLRITGQDREKRLTFVYNLLKNVYSDEDYTEKEKIRILGNYFDLLYVKDEVEVSRLWLNYINEEILKNAKSFWEKIAALKKTKIGLALPWNRKNERKTFVNGVIAYYIFKIIVKMKFLRNKFSIFDKDHEIDRKYRENTLTIFDNLLLESDKNKIFSLIEKVEKVRGYGKVRIRNIQKYFPKVMKG